MFGIELEGLFSSRAELLPLEDEVKQQIQTAIDRAEQQMQELGNPLDMFDHLYAELPPNLKTQKNQLIRELGNSDEEVDHD